MDRKQRKKRACVKKSHYKSRISDVNRVPEMMKRGILSFAPQKLLGISDLELGELFQLATFFLEQHETADAVRSFTLLCYIHPYMSDFWYGLGMSLKEIGEYDDALSAFSMAETLDPSRSEFYIEAVECSLKLHRKKLAHKIFNRLMAHQRVLENFQEQKTIISALEKKLSHDD